MPGRAMAAAPAASGPLKSPIQDKFFAECHFSPLLCCDRSPAKYTGRSVGNESHGSCPVASFTLICTLRNIVTASCPGLTISSAKALA